MKYDITVLIFTYKRPKLLARAIQSVLDQSGGYPLIKIFDNASGDETEQVVRKFQQEHSNIKYVKREKNVGPLKNFHLALAENIETPFFSFLADDDFYLPNFFKNSLKCYEACPELGMVINNSASIQGANITRSSLPSSKSVQYSVSHLIDRMPFFYAVLYSNKVLTIKPNFDLATAWMCDLDFIYSCALHFPYKIEDEVAAVCQVWDKTATTDILNSNFFLSVSSLNQVYRSVHECINQMQAGSRSKHFGALRSIRNWLCLDCYRHIANLKTTKRRYVAIRHLSSLGSLGLGWVNFVCLFIFTLTPINFLKKKIKRVAEIERCKAIPLYGEMSYYIQNFASQHS